MAKEVEKSDTANFRLNTHRPIPVYKCAFFFMVTHFFYKVHIRFCSILLYMSVGALIYIYICVSSAAATVRCFAISPSFLFLSARTYEIVLPSPFKNYIYNAVWKFNLLLRSQLFTVFGEGSLDAEKNSPSFSSRISVHAVITYVYSIGTFFVRAVFYFLEFHQSAMPKVFFFFFSTTK